MASRGDIKIKNIQPNLFEGWLKLNFSDTLDKTSAFTKLKSKEYYENGVYPVIDQGESFIAGYVNDDDLIYQGDIPIIIFGDHTRIIKYIDFPFAVGADGTKILNPYSFLNSKFFFYYLQSLKIPSLGYSRHFKILKEVDIPIPPLPEQQRIVTKLDALFAEIETAKEKFEKISVLIKQLKQAVLTQAITGKLTEEWRRGKCFLNQFKNVESDEFRISKLKLPLSWKNMAFSSIATIKSNLVNPNDYLDFPLIAPDNIEKETGRLINKPLVKHIKPKSSKHFFLKNSIIYSKIRPYLSKVIIADFDGLCSADMYPVTTELEIQYLYFYMLSEHFLSYATTAGTRSVLPKINQKGIAIIPVPVPPLKEQLEIVKRVESLFTKIDTIEQHYNLLKTQIDNLPQTILAKAFKGELVEQFPTDGDARELLEEIKKMKKEVNIKSKKKKR